MPFHKRVLTCLSVMAVGIGCGPAEPDPIDEQAAAEAEASLQAVTFNVHKLMTDDDVLGGAWIKTADVQKFLQKKNSFLATYVDPAKNKTAAALIVERSQAYGISPLFMLARIETESGLIGGGTSANVAKATGCGCPDAQSCNPAFLGFGNQIDCAAIKTSSYFADLKSKGATIAGWSVGKAKTTFDPCTVTPGNKATAALYTYTPWVGAYGAQCGKQTVGGATLVAKSLAKFKVEQDFGPPECYSATVGKTLPVNSCVQSSSDARWRQCKAGAWVTLASTATPSASACNGRHPHCYSATLGRSVPPRSCVQARSDKLWFQCVEEGIWEEAPSAATLGSGPAGTCFASYAL